MGGIAAFALIELGRGVLCREWHFSAVPNYRTNVCS